MSKYRKKPIIIDAFQMTHARRADNSEWPEWMNRAWNRNHSEPNALTCVDFPESDGTDKLAIFTLEGVMVVEWGDWLICGVKGELYPCKPDIFELTYEPIYADAQPSELDQLRKENDFLRALTASSDKACVYCGLGAAEMGQCARGFPGCARADDQMLCPEVGVAMERDQLRKRVVELEVVLTTVGAAVADIGAAISSAEYRAEELANYDGWQTVADMMRDGTFASLRDTVAAALASGTNGEQHRE